MSNEATFPPFRNDRALVLTPFPNGGWVVSQMEFDVPGGAPISLGAFSDADSMLLELQKVLVIDRPHDDDLVVRSNADLVKLAKELFEEKRKGDIAWESLLSSEKLYWIEQIDTPR